MLIAYLINQYPKVSHSFIRREILELERQGWQVQRIALRRCAEPLADADDRAEQARTRYLLDGWRAGPALAGAVLGMLLRHPLRLLRAAALAARTGWRARRPLPWHAVYLAQACRLAGWLHQSGARHLHAHFGTNAAQVAMLARALGGPPFSFTVHGPEEFDHADSLKLREKTRHAAFVAAVSAFGSSQLYRGLPHAEWPKVRVVRCGLGHGYSTLQALPAAPQLVCVGRLCAQKGQLLLVEALHLLRRAGVPALLTLAGDGELRPALEQLIARRGLQDQVRITGWLSGAEVRQAILAARGFVLPSFAEGLPVALMEAMALRRPVISTYIAGIPELVVPGEHGWLVPAGDLPALVQALAALLAAPPQQLERMGDQARLAVLRQHSLERSVAALGACFSAAAAP